MNTILPFRVYYIKSVIILFPTRRHEMLPGLCTCSHSVYASIPMHTFYRILASMPYADTAAVVDM